VLLCVYSGGETFTASGSVVLRPGFTAIMPWKVSSREQGWEGGREGGVGDKIAECNCPFSGSDINSAGCVFLLSCLGEATVAASQGRGTHSS